MYLNRMLTDGPPPLLERVSLPDPVSTKIFLLLDGSSLHQARQVCREWNQFILEQVWGSNSGRREQERKLKEQWDLASPTIIQKTVTVEEGATIVEVIEDYVVAKISRTSREPVLGEEEPSRKRKKKSSWWEVTITASLIVNNWKTGESVELELGGQSHVSLAGVHLVRKQGRTIIIAVLRGNYGILGWDLENQEKLFHHRSFNYGESLLDQSTQEIVVFGGFESNTWDTKLKRVKITEDLNISVEVYDQPGCFQVTKGVQYNELRVFSSPFLATKANEISTAISLWRFGETQIEKIGSFSCFPRPNDVIERYFIDRELRRSLRLGHTENIGWDFLKDLHIPVISSNACGFHKDLIVVVPGSSLPSSIYYIFWFGGREVRLNLPGLPAGTGKRVKVGKTNILVFDVKKNKQEVSLTHFNFWK